MGASAPFRGNNGNNDTRCNNGFILFYHEFVARGYQTLDPEMLSDGLNRLNGFIALKSVEKKE